jgi:hypothetical protein
MSPRCCGIRAIRTGQKINIKMLTNLFKQTIMALLFSGAFAVCAFADQTQFPHPSFSQSGRFTIGPPQPVESLKIDGVSAAYIFSRAKASCALDSVLTQQRLQSAIDQWAIPSTKKIFPNIKDTLQQKDLTILIDDLGDLKSIFSAFFVRLDPQSNKHAIVLDCSAVSQRLWGPTLAHEFTHLMLEDKNIDAWLEEGIAQLAEKDAASAKIELTLSHLSESKKIPLLHDPRKVIHGNDSYGISYLFANYILQNFGTWDGIRALLEIDTDCLSETSDFSRRICSLKSFAQSSDALKSKSNILTPKGVSRYFALALILNDPKFRLASLEDWVGFKNLDLVSRDEINEREFMTFSASQTPLVKEILQLGDKKLEIYAIYKTAAGRNLKMITVDEVLPNDIEFFILINFNFLPNK